MDNGKEKEIIEEGKKILEERAIKGAALNSALWTGFIYSIPVLLFTVMSILEIPDILKMDAPWLMFGVIGIVFVLSCRFVLRKVVAEYGRTKYWEYRKRHPKENVKI